MEMIPMTTTTDLSKKQLTTILSALDDAPRSPANKGEALRAIGGSAERLGLTTDDVLAAAPGLLDGRLSLAEFRAELQDLGGASCPATNTPQGAPGEQEGDVAPEESGAPAQPALAAQEAKPARRRARAKAKPTASIDKPTPRIGTKQARMIELLKRPEGATVEQIAKATGWQHHTIRGAISGALKKKLGLPIEATRTRGGSNKAGAKGSSIVYRIVG
jgi:Protein of unknown function (DUF3489)